MLHARRAFFDRGFFESISEAINVRVVRHLNHLRSTKQLRGTEAIVDVGCGEGYYLHRLAQQLQRERAFHNLRLVGLDASKDAARLTASRLASGTCAVVDVERGLHVRRGSAAVLLNIFAPRNSQAFAETLMPGGLCLVVLPRPEHMKQLADLVPLLDIPSSKQARVQQQFRPPFTAIGSQELAYRVVLDTDAIAAWVKMGPNAWHVTDEQLSRLRVHGGVQTQIACTVLSFLR
jgi:SAM-dependent methyltransferase